MANIVNYHELFEKKDIIFRSPICSCSPDGHNKIFIETLCYHNCRIIVQPPRMKIAYGIKKYKDGYSYCISFADNDIDPEIDSFYQFVQLYDEMIVKYLETSPVLEKIDAPVYHQSLMQKTENHSYYMRIKILTEKGIPLTIVNSCDRKSGHVQDIIYGTYVDQYLELKGILCYGNDIHAIYYAHQVVISPYERVFLKTLLLDDISPLQEVPTPPPPPLYTPPRIYNEPHCLKSQPTSRIVINLDELQSIKNRLKPTIKQDSLSCKSTGRITVEDLAEGMQILHNNSIKKIMLESVNDKCINKTRQTRRKPFIKTS